VHSAEYDIITRPADTAHAYFMPVRPAPHGVCYPEEATPTVPIMASNPEGPSVLRFGWFQVEMKRVSGTESRPECAIISFLDSVPGSQKANA
jgi:hypothetical protein